MLNVYVVNKKNYGINLKHHFLLSIHVIACLSDAGPIFDTINHSIIRLSFWMVWLLWFGLVQVPVFENDHTSVIVLKEFYTYTLSHIINTYKGTSTTSMHMILKFTVIFLLKVINRYLLNYKIVKMIYKIGWVLKNSNSTQIKPNLLCLVLFVNSIRFHTTFQLQISKYWLQLTCTIA
jgi:hypothetical protein